MRVGTGIGLDLKFLPDKLRITATDVIPAMLRLLNVRAGKHTAILPVQRVDG